MSMYSSSSPTMYSLPDDDVQFFKKNGYLIVPLSKHQLFDANTVYQWAYEIKGWPKVKGKWMAYDELNSEGERQIMKTEYFTPFHEGMSKLLREGGVPKILEQLSGYPMLLFKEKINYKAPKGFGFIAHMDAPSYDTVAKVEHLTVNIAVDPATMENGCLEVVPGSHKMEFIPDPIESKGATVPISNIDPEWCNRQTWVPAVLASGDMLIFGSHVAHRSGDNHSENSRAAIYATYSSILDGEDNFNQYYAQRRKMYPPEYEREEGKDYTDGYQFYAPSSYGELNIKVKNNGR